MSEQTAQHFRALPSVDRLLKHDRCAALLARYNHDYVTQKCREVLDQLRAEIRQAPAASGDLHEDAIMGRVEARIAAESQPGHVRVVNATGTILSKRVNKRTNGSSLELTNSIPSRRSTGSSAGTKTSGNYSTSDLTPQFPQLTQCPDPSVPSVVLARRQPAV